MKLTSKINPKRLFRSLKKPTRSVTRSDPSSFSSTTSTDSAGTPTTVLPTTSGDLSDLAHAFKPIEGDGKIGLNELEGILNRIGRNPIIINEDVRKMLREMDVDGDGCISMEELRAAAEEDDIVEAFKVFDTDCDGKITAEELFEVFNALGDDTCTLDECRRMVSEVGSGGGGDDVRFVCFDDFVRLMNLHHR